MADLNNNGFIVSLTVLAFVVLKLANIISWSWWWVFSPLWIALGLGLIILFIVEAFRRWT